MARLSGAGWAGHRDRDGVADRVERQQERHLEARSAGCRFLGSHPRRRQDLADLLHRPLEFDPDASNLKRFLVCADRKGTLVSREADPRASYRSALPRAFRPCMDSRPARPFPTAKACTCSPAWRASRLLTSAAKSSGRPAWARRPTPRGSGTSPVLYKDMVIVNASVESGEIVALKKASGTKAWCAEGRIRTVVEYAHSRLGRQGYGTGRLVAKGSWWHRSRQGRGAVDLCRHQ